MEEMKNFAEITFTNPVLIDVFGRYTDNSVLATFVEKDGSIRMKFRVEPPVDPPKCCEQVLSLLYALFESNPDSPIGRVYINNQQAILRETVYRLTQILDGFSDVKMTICVTDPETDAGVRTEFTLTRRKTST